MTKHKIINKGKECGGKKRRRKGLQIENTGDNHNTLYIMYEVVKRELLINLLKYTVYRILFIEWFWQNHVAS